MGPPRFRCATLMCIDTTIENILYISINFLPGFTPKSESWLGICICFKGIFIQVANRKQTTTTFFSVISLKIDDLYIAFVPAT